MKDRGTGVATSMFGTYIRKGEFIIYPFFEYYRDEDLEYNPDEFGGQVVLASDVCGQFQKEADSRGLRLEAEGPERPVLVMGNDPSLRRLVASLLENAFAHTRTGGIAVSVRDDETAELSVADTGEGIPEEALGRIFDRFYRVDSSRSRETGGHGLGLSIALRIATLHDAEVTAESRLGEGSRFTVRFRRKGGDR